MVNLSNRPINFLLYPPIARKRMFLSIEAIQKKIDHLPVSLLSDPYSAHLVARKRVVLLIQEVQTKIEHLPDLLLINPSSSQIGLFI